MMINKYISVNLLRGYQFQEPGGKAGEMLTQFGLGLTALVQQEDFDEGLAQPHLIETGLLDQDVVLLDYYALERENQQSAHCLVVALLKTVKLCQ